MESLNSPTNDYSQFSENLQQHLLRMVMDNLPEYVFWKDRNSVFLGCNQKLADVAGVGTPENIIGKTDYDLPWKTEEAAFFRECDRRVMASGIPELGILEPQLQADGRQAWLETNKIPLRDAQGKVIGIMGSFQDVTAKYEAELALKRLNEELEQRVEARTAELQRTLEQLQQVQMQMVQAEKMSSLGQLVAGIAHEINNPINFIQGNLQHVQTYAKTLMQAARSAKHPADHLLQPPEATIDLDFVQSDLPKILHSMQTGTDRVKEIVLSLRNFSRLDESAFKTAKLHEGLNSTLLILSHRCVVNHDRRAISIIKDYGELPPIECYPGNLNQVFLNLITNAIDSLDTSSHPMPRITIQTRTIDEQQVSIRISNNGDPIPADIQSRLFDPFFTTKPIGKGTGMGLSITYQIITSQHHGQIDYHDDPTLGTTFTIALPIRQTTPK